MSFHDFLDQTYWVFLMVSPLAYMAINLGALKRTDRRVFLYLLLVDFTIFATSSVSFLMGHSMVFRGNVVGLRAALSVIMIVRIPVGVILYSQLANAVPDRRPSDPAADVVIGQTDVPNQTADPVSPSRGCSPLRSSQKS